jgi:hypothetical protein
LIYKCIIKPPEGEGQKAEKVEKKRCFFSGPEKFFEMMK